MTAPFSWKGHLIEDSAYDESGRFLVDGATYYPANEREALATCECCGEIVAPPDAPEANDWDRRNMYNRMVDRGLWPAR